MKTEFHFVLLTVSASEASKWRTDNNCWKSDVKVTLVYGHTMFLSVVNAKKDKVGIFLDYDVSDLYHNWGKSNFMDILEEINRLVSDGAYIGELDHWELNHISRLLK